jgi:hypothetical protein
MKMMTKIVSLFLLLSLLITPMAACRRNGDDSLPPPEEGGEQITPPSGELNDIPVEGVTLISAKLTLMVGERVDLDAAIAPKEARPAVSYQVVSGAEVVRIEGERLIALAVGTAEVVAVASGVQSAPLTITVTEAVDPYASVDKTAFYANYTPADSYLDACYRTQHGLMSGGVTVPDQAPTVSEYQPKRDDMLIRNSVARYEDDGNTYVVVDAYGQEVMEIYRGAAYITLEEVAAYVFAFGHIPANYIGGKSASPSGSVWGEYLRLNHSNFTGNTKKYPYEPELPNISGCGGDFQYYEIDIGTTGTDCDPGYTARIYNDGNRITRGAARIVYARFDKNGNQIIEPSEKYVFYTYNHYNDFQEYLNYFGGWGVMFGNITGGGKISSKTECNPTPYVPVYVGKLSVGQSAATTPTLEIVCILPEAWREWV